jgi:hypothetical protein
MIPPLVTRDWARQLLDYETAVGATSMPVESAGACVYEKLRRSLCELAGVAGFHSLASRALMLATSNTPSLSAVQIAADGSLQGLNDAEPPADNHHVREGDVVLIAQLLKLLLIFIGQSLTLSLVRDVWPDIAIDDTIPGTGEKHERAR